jgi:predicted nucleotidyltransferase
VIADLNSAAASVQLLVTGAFARDLHLFYLHGIPLHRVTMDIDVGVAVENWSQFSDLRRRLLDSGRFSASGVEHRILHASGRPVDVVPFGGVEDASRRLAWPPRGDVQMDVFGFREALESSIEVTLPGGVQTRVVSLPALATLKLVAWADRHFTTPRKDAEDLWLIVANYMDCGGRERLFDDFPSWTQDPDFDLDESGARMLGHDVAGFIGAKGRERIASILSEQTSVKEPGTLPAEMNPFDPDRARKLLASMLVGLRGARG